MSRSKNKRNKAVALKYNAEQDVAPVVIASGYGSIAEKIIDIAEQKGIPVFRDDSAASLMCMLEVGSNIPPELYEIVAAVYCQLLEKANEIKNIASAAGVRRSEEKTVSQRLAQRRRMYELQEMKELEELEEAEPQAGQDDGYRDEEGDMT